jgi:hypothetical protein
MKFFSALAFITVLTSVTAQRGQREVEAECVSSVYNDKDNVAFAEAADLISIMCRNPTNGERDIDIVSGRSGNSLHQGTETVINVKVFAAPDSCGNYTQCETVFNTIHERCKSRKYGRVRVAGQYYAISFIPGDQNLVWV